MDRRALWNRYQDRYIANAELGFALDTSRMDASDEFFASMQKPFEKAFAAMEELEKGAIANPDEKRMVGHYWLRNPNIAPEKEANETKETLTKLKDLVEQIHSGYHRGPDGDLFTNVVIVGIGGSALGPQLAQAALTNKHDLMDIHFLDNTDPDGMDLVFEQIESKIKKTLVVVVSKSGGTKETRNGMLEIKNFFEKHDLVFEKQAVAITGEGSALDQIAVENKWIARIPMFDYIGGRTSQMAAVGLFPAALQGIDIDEFLLGAAAMDKWTRTKDVKKNPAAMMASLWYYATNGKGEKDMVIIPYKDRLVLLSKYLQQLVMESLGKEFDLDGNVVNQGIAVYGNKGSTDQHAYVQQLREGVLNFFVVFIQVLRERDGDLLEVEDNITSGDYLNGFRMGTRSALYEKGRESMTITIDELNERTLGMIIALFERAVGFYASLVNINAYHQPGVEAGKKAAGEILELQLKLQNALTKNKGEKLTAEQWAEKIGDGDLSEDCYEILMHLSANRENIKAENPFDPAKATFYG